MSMTDCVMNGGRWLLAPAVCILFGCAGGPQQQRGSWPWEYTRENGRYPTGDYVAVSGPVATLGGAPKAVKPIPLESLAPPVPGAPAAMPPSSLAPQDAKPGTGAVAGAAKRGYDFTVNETKIAPPSYLPVGSVREAYDIIASNRGNAPVSVTIGSDPGASLNMATDKALPLTAVVPPHTDRTLVHVSVKVKNEAYRFGYTCSWSIGDHDARHQCPERYRFPFGDKVRAFAGVSDAVDSTPYTRYAVIFSLPAPSPVLTARKGTVVRIAPDDKIDILHDDATIATYSHLGKIAEGVVVGKALAAGDVVGTAGAADNRGVAFFQLTVWRPEPRPSASTAVQGPNPGYDLVSFPLEFCTTDSGGCRVLTRSQWVTGSKAASVKKQGKRGTKPAAGTGGGT